MCCVYDLRYAARCDILAATIKETQQNMTSASGARDYDQEQRHWANQLREDELAFANLFLGKVTNGYTNTQCYQMTHPNCVANLTATRMSVRMLRTFAVEKYIESMRHETISDTIMGLDELKADLTLAVRGYEWLFEGAVAWEDTPEGRIAFVDRLEDVPEGLRKYVEGYTYHTESEGYELHLRAYNGKESDRNKARELLAKMQGGLIEKRDLTVRGGLVSETISEEMTAEEAANVYKRTMKGGD